MIRIGIFCFLAFMLAQPSCAASFDCAKASTNVEKLICANPELSKLDEDLNKVYSLAIEGSSDPSMLKQEQRDWLKKRNKCNAEECLIASYSERIALLNQPTPNCTSTLENGSDEFEVYLGVGTGKNNYGVFAKRKGEKFGLTESTPSILNSNASAKVTSLCDGRLLSVWLPETFGNLTPYLHGKIYDHNFKPITEDFRITELDESQWEHSIAPLNNGRFVVVWKSQSDSGIKIRTRVFDSTGKPLLKSFDVSATAGNHGQASVYGIPSGGFVVIWNLFGKGVMLRLFSSKGVAMSPQVEVMSNSDISHQYMPYGVITKNGGINVFLAFHHADQKTPFEYARSIDENGAPVTELLSGSAINSLYGYQKATEAQVRERAHHLEYRLREFLQKDVMSFRFCNFSASDASTANALKKMTHDNAIKAFASKFCKQQIKSCGKAPYYHEQDQNKCAYSD